MLISPKTTSRFEIKFYMNWQNLWESWTKSPYRPHLKAELV